MSRIKERIRGTLQNPHKSNKEKAADLHNLITSENLEGKFAGIFLTILNTLDANTPQPVLNTIRSLVTNSEIGWISDSDTDLTAILRVVKDTDDIELSDEEEQGINRLIGLAEEVRRKTDGSD